MRRFQAGDRFTQSGVEFEVRPGRQGPDDLMLWWQTSTGWSPVDKNAIALVAAFMFENEEMRRPPAMGYKGGKFFADFLSEAMRNGFMRARENDEFHRQFVGEQDSLFGGAAS